MELLSARMWTSSCKLIGKSSGNCLFDDGLVLGKNLMVEIERRLERCIPVKIPANRHEHARLARGNWRRGVQNVQLSVVRKKDGELRGERQPRLKKPAPFEAGRVQMFEAVRIIADGADVVGAKTGRGEFDRIARHLAVIEFAECSDMDKSKMAHVKKAFDLAAGGSVEFHAVRQNLQVIGVVPFVENRKW